MVGGCVYLEDWGDGGGGIFCLSQAGTFCLHGDIL